MKKLLVSLLLALVGSTASANPPERIRGIGKDRENLTEELLTERVNALMDALEFWILRNPAMQQAPERIFEDSMWKLIENSAKAEGLNPLDLAGLIAVESQGRPYAKSPTGPLGICQFSKATAKGLGLVETQTQRRTKVVWQGRGKKRHRVIKPYGRSVEVVVHDRRLDISYALPACAKWLALGARTYGSVEFAIQRHHNGDGRLMKILSLYTGKSVTFANAAQVVKQNSVTMAKVFFDNTPYRRAELYAYLEKIRKEADSAPSYFFRVRTARRLLEEYRASPQTYADKYQYYRTQFKDDGVSPSRMWYFYTPEQVQELQFADLLAIEDGRSNGRLVSLPQPWGEFGFTPRLSGKSPIAEKDPAHRLMYVQAEASTVGALMYVMKEVRLLQGRRFVPYEVSSLVRTLAYQGVLQASNSNAKTLLPTHTMGKAFDLPMKGVSPQRRRDLLFILADMDAYGMISYIPEGSQDTIHVVPHPNWETFFQKVYRQAVTSTVDTISSR